MFLASPLQKAYRKSASTLYIKTFLRFFCSIVFAFTGLNFLQLLSLKTKYFPTGKAVGYTQISASSESILNATYMKKK